jgi:type IV pilus assembly protein PilW
MKPIVKDQKGFSLVELMVAMAIGAIVLAGVYRVFNTQQQSQVTQQVLVHMNQNLRAALQVMTTEIRMAGFDQPSSGGEESTIIAATASSLTFEKYNTLESRIEAITYYITGGNLMRKLETVNSSGPPRTWTVAEDVKAAEGVENMQFYYTMSDGSQTLTPTADVTSPRNEYNDVRSISINILARTYTPIRGYTDTKSYTTVAGTTWGPFMDPYKRKILYSSVAVRNMGL